MGAFVILFFLSSFAKADLILNCREYKYTSIVSKKKDSRDLSVRSEENIKDASKITVVIQKNKGLLKGNMGQSELIKLNETTFIEKTGLGIVVWTLMSGEMSDPIFLIQQKSYMILKSIYSAVVAYKCE